MLSVSPEIARKRLYTSQFNSWEEEIECLPGIISFERSSVSYLSRVLSRFNSTDHYLTCPAYYAFTGRFGLWGFSKGKSRNPERKSQIIVFPQFGPVSPNLTAELIEKTPFPSGGYKLARYDYDQAEFFSALMNKRSSHYKFSVQIENELDWTYPVHTVPITKALSPAGRSMKSYRQHLSRLDMNKINLKPIRPDTDLPLILPVVDDWLKARQNSLSREHVIGSYYTLVDLMKCQNLNLEGIIYYYNKKSVALDIWALPDNNKKVASCLAGVSNMKIDGFSEYQIYAIAKILEKKGVHSICLGGSESEGLDKFKRKLNPTESLDLRSITVSPKRKRYPKATRY